MNKKISIFIIIVLSIAITSLLILEGVLVNMLILKEKNQFDYAVNTVLSETAKHLYSTIDTCKRHEWHDSKFLCKISENIIDSLIFNGLKKLKINIAYDYTIYSPREGIIYYKGISNIEKLKSSEYKYVINFDKSQNTSSHYLFLYFPDKTSFLIKQIHTILYCIGGLILLTICIFVWAIIIIYKQLRISKMRKNIIPTMAHEFKTPITTIKLLCEALKDPLIKKNSDFLQTHLSIISEETKRMQTIAEQILHYTKMNISNFDLDHTKINMEKIITDVIKSMQVQINARKATVITHFNAFDPYFLGDKMHITNIINDMLDNSLTYNDKECKIQISTENKKHHIILCIEDNGIGITKSQQKRIFEQFYRAPTGGLFNSNGFGIGLNYVKTIVEKHHGSIRVKSEPHKWTKFYIKIPNKKIKL